MTEPKTSGSQEIKKDFSGNDKFPEQCAICLQLIKNQSIGKPDCCNHQFCAFCIFQWHNKSNVCPLDRRFFFEIRVYQNKWSTNHTITFSKCKICRLSGREEHMLFCSDCKIIMHSHCGVIPMEHIRVPFYGYYLCVKCIKKRSSLMMGPITEVSVSASHLSPRGKNKSSGKCTICLFTVTKNQKVGSLESCGHWFCASCIIEWSDKSNVCPLDKKPFTIIFIYEKRNGFLENMYCKCRLCRDNQFLSCTDCKSTVNHERPNKSVLFSWEPKTDYLCSYCSIKRSRRAATSLNEEVQTGASATDAQSKATESHKRGDLANSSMSSSVSARNEIQNENQRQEKNNTRNQTVHRNKDKDLLLNKSSKKNNNDTESSFNSRSLQRSRSSIRWRAGSPIRKGAGSPIRRRAGSSIRRRVGSPIREVSRNTCLLRMDWPSISKSRFPSSRKKHWRRSTYKSSRRSVLWTDDGILKVVVR